MEPFLQLVLVSFLVLLDELSVSFQSVARLLQQFFEAQPQLVFMFRRYFAIKQVPVKRFAFILWFYICLFTYLRNTLAISIGPWLTVVPMQPCNSIWRIFGSLALIAASILATFICMSSMATSMGVSTICFCWATWILVLM